MVGLISFMSLDLGDLGKINLIGFINNAIDYTVLTIDFLVSLISGMWQVAL